MMRTAFAPGRVNLIGEHTDYTGGYVVPMAVHLGTTVEVELGGDEVCLVSNEVDGVVRIPLDRIGAGSVDPGWGRLIAAVVDEVRPAVGVSGTVSTTLPIGAGLSSSAALAVAVALALGDDGAALEVARRCQRAEQRATGVPCGIMDQLASVAGVAGHALLIDCSSLVVAPVPLPDEVSVVAVHSGQARTLVGSEYAERADSCHRAEAMVGPLRHASLSDLASITEPTVRRRARHVVSENERAVQFVDALRAGDLTAAGHLMSASHRSLRDDFAVSTPALDQLVEQLSATAGVYGARLTGAGFGGCAVALCEPGAPVPGWVLRPVAGAGVHPPLR